MRKIILDTETTGLDPVEGHKIVEIGCVEMINRVRTGKFYHAYINPIRNMPKKAFEIHGISEEFLKDKPVFREVAGEFMEFISGSTLVIHNAKFDLKFLNAELAYIGMPNLVKMPYVDTLEFSRKKFPGSPASLDALCKRFKIDLSRRDKHGALLDAELLAEVYIHLTGGNQVALDLTESIIEEVSNKLPKQFKEPRLFDISADELEEHDKIMQKISNPIWVS